MKRNKLLILLLVFSLILSFLLIVFENIGIKENVVVYSSLWTDDIGLFKEGRTEKDALLEEICFNGIPLLYDETDHCFYYSLSNDENAYDPLVSWNSNQIRVIFEKKEISQDLISSNGEIEFIAYDSSRYCIYRIKCTNLPLINIEKFYDDLNFSYDNSVITIIDNQKNTIETYDAKVRIRGGSTSELPKPGLRIKFDKILKGDNNRKEKHYDLLGLESDNEFVLYTSNVEKDLIRNVFSTNLWYETCADDNAFAMKFGMSYRYCEVFVNHHYWGLCALGNAIDASRDYVDLDPDSEKYLIENIYKMNFFGERELLDYEKYPKDFLFSIKTNIDSPEAWKPLIDYLQLLLYSDDIERFYESIDLNNAIDIYLFYNLTQAWDNVWYEDGVKFRNTFLVSKVAEDGTVRMIYLPWDLDRTWGHCREDGLVYPMDYTVNYDMIAIAIENLIELKDERINELILNKYLKLRNGKWSDEQILKMLDQYEEQVYFSGAFERDKLRWPQNDHGDYRDLSEFKEYVLKRLSYFDDYISRKFS